MADRAIPDPRLIALGLYPSFSVDVKFGFNTDIDTTSVPEDIWGSGGEYTGHPTGDAETIEAFSADAADTSAGTGARTIEVVGLDANWAAATETITLSGVTAVATTSTWRRVNRIKVLTAGSGGENAGVLTVRHETTTANVFGTVPAGANQSNIAAYTVPDGNRMVIMRIRAAIAVAGGVAGTARFSLRVREPGEVFRAARHEDITAEAPSEYAMAGGIVCPARTDVKMRCEDVSANNTAVTGLFEYLLVPNVDDDVTYERYLH